MISLNILKISLIVCVGNLIVVQSCIDCNRVGGTYVNNVPAGADPGTDPIDISTNNMLARAASASGISQDVLDDDRIIGVGNAGGHHEVKYVRRRKRCIDCGNKGGNHVVVGQCVDCLNRGGAHNNFIPG